MLHERYCLSQLPMPVRYSFYTEVKHLKRPNFLKNVNLIEPHNVCSSRNVRLLCAKCQVCEEQGPFYI